MKKIMDIRIFLTVFLFGLIACEPKGRESNNDKASSLSSCDSVSHFGVSFRFSENEKIDSIQCFKGEDHRIPSAVRKEKDESSITIYDTVVFENEYKLILYSHGFSKTHSIKNILWKPKRVYNGMTCSLKSCVFNDSLIEGDAGRFDLRQHVPVEN